MSLQRADVLHASGVYDAASGNAYSNQGFTRFEHLGVGVYRLTCDEPIGALEAQLGVLFGVNEVLIATPEIITPGVVLVRVYDALRNPSDCVTLRVMVWQVQTGPVGVLPSPPIPSPIIPPGGPVLSVFGRVGVVIAMLNDYVASLIGNDSSVPGATVADALDTLAGAIPPPSPVSSVFGRVGAVIAALNDYVASLIGNDSSVAGATVADALDTLAAAGGAISPLDCTTWGGARPAQNWNDDPAMCGYGNSTQSGAGTGTVTFGAFAITSARERALRVHYEGTSPAGGTNIFYANSMGTLGGLVWRGDAAGRGGFRTMHSFATPEIVETRNLFVGLMAGNGNRDPGDIYYYPDKIGLYWDDTHANLHIVHTDAGGTSTFTDLGASFARSTTAAYALRLSADPNAATIDWEVLNLENGATASGTAAATLPTNTVLLNPYFAANNGFAAAAAPTLDLIGLHYESVFST